MKITDFGYNGEGVGHEGGKVCFVPYTLVGEEVEIEKRKVTSSYIKAEAKNILEASTCRREPPCPYFTKCGGCDFQHISYQDELKLKEQILARQLAKLGFNKKIEVVASPQEYNYRNKIKLFCNEKGLGLKRGQSDKVINIKHCLLVDEKTNTLFENLNNFILKNHLQKQISTVTIRRYERYTFLKFDLNREINVDFTGLSLLLGEDVFLFLSMKGGDKKRLYGKDIKADEHGLTYNFDMDAFRQVNNEVAEKLYDNICALVKGGNVLNAYSGAGVLSGMLAKHCRDVVGVELGNIEHESAESLKEENSLANLTNIQGDCGEVIPQLENKFDFIVLDPPRSGCDESVCKALNMQEGRLIYVSCNPATLVRDIARMDRFELMQVTLFDMFPRTANFEVLVILGKKQ